MITLSRCTKEHNAFNNRRAARVLFDLIVMFRDWLGYFPAAMGESVLVLPPFRLLRFLYRALPGLEANTH
jgi:hypothetical protein